MMENNLIICLFGSRGRSLKVYDDKVVITVKAGLGSFITGNATDGEKTIYYSDCIGVQYKKEGVTLGYLQFETASGIMNNRFSNFFNENTFTWDSKCSTTVKKIPEIVQYIKGRVDYYKKNKNVVSSALSSADEIKKYKELLDDGVISQEEFNAKKKELLGI